MITRKVLTAVFGVVLACTAFLPLASASEKSQQTKVVFARAVEIPGQVLPAGTYWFVMTGDTFDRNFVRIYSADRKTVYATIGTVQTQRLQPANGTTFTFAERESSQPEALLKWFSPGETVGHEFQYPKREERELAQDQQQVVVAAPMGESRAGY